MRRPRALVLAPIVLCLLHPAGRPAVGDYTLTTLATFSGANGSEPLGGVTLDAQGNLYGTTQTGGANGRGNLFMVAAGTHDLTTLAIFGGANGAFPNGDLTSDAQGNLYGTTAAGGTNGGSTVFMVAAGTHDLTTIASLRGSNVSTYMGVSLDSQGNLYATSPHGATLYMVAAGTHDLTTIATFGGTNGSFLNGFVTPDGQGNLYGTAGQTVYMVAAGTHILSTIASLSSVSNGPLTLDAQGNLYGTTLGGAAGDFGTVFMVAAGTREISTIARFGGVNGTYPFAGVVIDSQGNLYGTTPQGGPGGLGTVYMVAAGTHTLSTIASFNGDSNGFYPIGGVTLDARGNLYGTTSIGGDGGRGTVFELVKTSGVVPEPASALFLGQAMAIAGAALAVHARRRRARSR